MPLAVELELVLEVLARLLVDRLRLDFCQRVTALEPYRELAHTLGAPARLRVFLKADL